MLHNCLLKDRQGFLLLFVIKQDTGYQPDREVSSEDSKKVLIQDFD